MYAGVPLLPDPDAAGEPDAADAGGLEGPEEATTFSGAAMALPFLLFFGRFLAPFIA